MSGKKGGSQIFLHILHVSISYIIIIINIILILHVLKESISHGISLRWNGIFVLCQPCLFVLLSHIYQSISVFIYIEAEVMGSSVCLALDRNEPFDLLLCWR